MLRLMKSSLRNLTDELVSIRCFGSGFSSWLYKLTLAYVVSFLFKGSLNMTEEELEIILSHLMDSEVIWINFIKKQSKD